jgi:hypothetical protein
MSDLVVNNPNILVDTQLRPGGRRFPDRAGRTRTEGEMAAVRQLRRIRREIEETVCSATWAEDCLYRGADYPPDFRCSCPVCRNLFPNRLHPRPVRESKYAPDCQIEAEEDPEFSEDFLRLRNDRMRIGSVFIAHSTALAHC